MDNEDTDLQDQVNNAVADDTGSDADNENLDDNQLDEGEDDSTSGSDDDGGDTDTSDAAGGSDTSGAEDDDEEDEEDPVSLAIMRSAMTQGAEQDETFDIRKLPRDENGLIDPEAANKAIQDWSAKREQDRNTGDQALNQVRQQLSGQWQKGAEKFGHIWKNKDLRDIALAMHLNSFEKARTGTGQYVSPLTALKKVDKMYNRAFKSGVNSQKTRRRVVETARTERGSGSGSTAKNTAYAELKKQAASRDPAKAAEGRRQLIIYRRNARRASTTA